MANQGRGIYKEVHPGTLDVDHCLRDVCGYVSAPIKWTVQFMGGLFGIHKTASKYFSWDQKRRDNKSLSGSYQVSSNNSSTVNSPQNIPNYGGGYVGVRGWGRGDRYHASHIHNIILSLLHGYTNLVVSDACVRGWIGWT